MVIYVVVLVGHADKLRECLKIDIIASNTRWKRETYEYTEYILLLQRYKTLHNQTTDREYITIHTIYLHTLNSLPPYVHLQHSIGLVASALITHTKTCNPLANSLGYNYIPICIPYTHTQTHSAQTNKWQTRTRKKPVLFSYGLGSFFFPSCMHIYWNTTKYHSILLKSSIPNLEVTYTFRFFRRKLIGIYSHHLVTH